ncbi:hypothetical protein midi_00952 [Candidatus Midichloria mitochondrii IricVA]|uniref:Uncharacterized protein n=2 Tax=Candidatus Midichloria mitochondrii TaxID=234827 RepID=F7XX34_MIDMI|nr:hypothetical protein midi_00952 [Candidatus Midichloria mitochondrii IricVA]
MMPYLLWILFASYLNFYIWQHNLCYEFMNVSKKSIFLWYLPHIGEYVQIIIAISDRRTKSHPIDIASALSTAIIMSF